MSAVPATVFLEGEFFGLVVLSLLLPGFILVWLARKRSIARISVALVGLALVGLSGIDAILLQRLSALARRTPSLADDRVFASEFSLALYVVPLITAGMGVNLLSHLLHEHLVIAELEFDRKRRRSGPGRDESTRHAAAAAAARGPEKAG
jgi:hypothetical protein